MKTSILYINNTYITCWEEFKDVVIKSFSVHSDDSNKNQDEILASIRDGIVYDWLKEIAYVNAENLLPSIFDSMTDSNVIRYLMHFIGNDKDSVKHICISEFVELLPKYSIIRSDGTIQNGFINGAFKIHNTSDCAIQIEFKVIKPANEEFIIKALGANGQNYDEYDSLTIKTRNKGRVVSYKLDIKTLMRFQYVKLEVDEMEILTFKLMDYDWGEIKSELVQNIPSEISIICEGSDARINIQNRGNEILKSGENRFKITEYPNLSKRFVLSGNLSNVKNIILNNLDTSNYMNMSGLFKDCVNITQLFLGRFNTSKVVDFSKMFEKCSSLMSLDLSSFDTSKVKDMSDMFNMCTSLISLNLDSFDTSKVKDMSRMFYNCESITALNLSAFDTSRVTSMNNMFARCKSLLSLDVRRFSTKNVIDMDGIFYGCESLEILDLHNFNTSNIQGFQSMFSGCKSLKILNLSGWEIRSARDIFSGCENLEMVNAIGCSFTTINKIKDQLRYAGLYSTKVITNSPV